MSARYQTFTITLTGTLSATTLSARGEGGLIAHATADATPLFTAPLGDAVQQIRTGYAPSPPEMQAIGSALYMLLFQPDIAAVWHTALARAEANDAHLRLRLEIVVDDLLALPWELLYDPHQQVFMTSSWRVAVVRGVAQAGVAVQPLRREGQANILRVVANPLDYAAFTPTDDAWLTACWQGRGTVTTLHAATVAALQNALLTGDYHILHVDGHGGWNTAAQDGYLVLEDAQGSSWRLSSHELLTLLGGTSVRLVVLAACQSGQSGAVKQLAGVAQRLMSGSAIPAVVAMQYDVPDGVAQQFAETFYTALAEGLPLESAVTEGRKAILTRRGSSEAAWATPVLYLRTEQGDLFSTPQQPRPFQVSAPPGDQIPRPALLDALRTQLLVQGQAATVGVYGAPGYGKTSLVQVLCHDPAVRRAYPDGILWVTLGKNPENLVGKVMDWITSLGGVSGNFTTLPPAMQRLNETLAARRCLLVIDDVWQAQHASPFLAGVNCARLLTSRIRSQFPPNAALIEVGSMTEDEAIALLGRGFAPDLVTVSRPALTALLTLVGEWAHQLSLLNGVLQARVRQRHATLPDALTYLRAALSKKGLDGMGKEERKRLAATLELSLEELDATQERPRFAELAIFAEDVPIPMAVVYNLWAGTAQWDEFDSDDLLSRLADLSLLASLDDRQQILTLHDEIRAILRDQWGAAGLAQLQAHFLDHYPATVWHTLTPQDVYLWQWLSYHLEEAQRTATLYEWVTDPAFRHAQQAVLADSRVTLNDITRAFRHALNDGALERVFHLSRTHRDVAQHARVSDDLFNAVQARKWELAATLASYYGTPPHLQNRWVVILYLLIGWEAAVAGAWEAAETLVRRAFAFHIPPTYPLRRLAEGIHQRIAETLGSQPADGLDSMGWIGRLGSPFHNLVTPAVSDTEAEAQLLRATQAVADFQRRLMVGDAETVSSFDFANEEHTEGESYRLSDALAQVATQPAGQQLIAQTLEAVLQNRYPFYRDIALGALGNAIMAIPDSAIVLALLRRMVSSALHDRGIAFEWELPAYLSVAGDVAGVAKPSALMQVLQLAAHTHDRWGTAFRVESAYAATHYYHGTPTITASLLQQLSGENPASFYAGYSVIHLLMLYNRYLEFRVPPPMHLLNAAAMQTAYISDQGYLAPARQRLVTLAQTLYAQGTIPTVAEVETLLSEEEDEDVQAFYCDYALARWLAAEPRQTTHIEALLPRLLERYTTLDLYLARWVAVGNTVLDPTVLSRTFDLLTESLVMPPPASGYG